MDEFLYKNENTESFLKYSNYFHKVYMKILNKHAPCKKNILNEIIDYWWTRGFPKL